MTEWILTSTILIVIVAAARYLLRGRVSLRVQYALWALVLARLLVPVSFGQSSISVMNALAGSVVETEVRQEAELSVGQNVPEYAAGQDIPAFGYIWDAQPNQPAEDTVTHTGVQPEVPEAPAKTEKIQPGTVLTAIWLLGGAVVALCFIFSNVRFGLSLRKSRREVETAGYPLKVYVSDKVETPCLFGLFRPAVYVTEEAATREKQLRHVLAHEATHYRHGDHVWSALRCICLAVHWYNPLVWLAAALSRRDAELACDEGTLLSLGEGERKDYGRTLIGLTCEKSGAGGLLLTATTMTGSKRGIKERIALIAKKPKMAVYTLIAVVLISALAVGCTFTGAKTGEELEPETEPQVLNLGLSHPCVTMEDGSVYFLWPNGDTADLMRYYGGQYETVRTLESGDPDMVSSLYLHENSLYFIGRGMYVHALDLDTMTERGVGDYDVNTLDFGILGDELYYIDGTVSGPLSALDLKTGEKRQWENEITPLVNRVCIVGEYIFYMDLEDKGGLYRTDRNGSAPEKWPGEGFSCLMATGTHLYGPAQGGMGVVDISDWEDISVIPIEGLSSSAWPMAVSGGTLWYNESGGRILYELDMETGESVAVAQNAAMVTMTGREIFVCSRDEGREYFWTPISGEAIVPGLTLNGDGTVGRLYWGDDLDSARAQLERDGFQVSAEAGEQFSDLIVEGQELLGVPVTIEYKFMKFIQPQSRDQLLYAIWVTPTDEEDLDTLKEKVSGVLGEMETQGVTASGSSYTLPEQARYWHSQETVTRDIKTTAPEQWELWLENDYIKNNPLNMSAEEYLDYISETWYFFEGRAAEEDGVSFLEFNGNYSVIWQLYQEQTESGTIPPAFSYEAEQGDVVIELTLEDLYDGEKGEFSMPGIEWDFTVEEIRRALGVDSLHVDPEYDPEVWINLSAGEQDVLLIPYFNFRAENTKSICFSSQRGDGDKESLPEKAAALEAAAIAAYGPAEESELETGYTGTSGQTITEKALLWRIEKEDGSTRSMSFVLEYYGDTLNRIYLLFGTWRPKENSGETAAQGFTQELALKLEKGQSDSDAITAGAWGLMESDMLAFAEEYAELEFTDAELLDLTLEYSFDRLVEGCVVELWMPDYALTSNMQFQDGAYTRRDDGTRRNDGAMGPKHVIALRRGDTAEVCGWVPYAPATEYNEDVLLHRLCAVLDGAGIERNTFARPETLTGWAALYRDFYNEKLRPMEELIYGVLLMDLSGNGTPELLVYGPGASASDTCEIYTIEDGQVRSFTASFLIGKSGIGKCGIGITCAYLAPAAANAMGEDFGFWADRPFDDEYPQKQPNAALFRWYMAEDGQSFYILNSRNGQDSNSWCDYYKFGQDENGYLTAERIFSVANYKEDGGMTWYIDGEKVTQEEYQAAKAEFEEYLGSLELQTELYSYRSVVRDSSTDDMTRSFMELLQYRS